MKALSLHEACEQACIYNFGAISLRYCFNFKSSLKTVNKFISENASLCAQQSIEDARIIFNLIRSSINGSRFFHMNETYSLVQINPIKTITPQIFKHKYSFEIATILRSEKDFLSEHKKNEIIDSALTYYRGALLIVDCNSSFIYDDDYLDLLEIFDFANIRHMELQYFDRTLDKQLNFVYDRQPYKIPYKAYFPLFGLISFDPIGELAKLRVDISVVLERLWSIIKFSDEPYYIEVYALLTKKLDFASWERSIDKKLEIINHIVAVYDHRVSSIRDDVQNILIIVLILIECILAAL